MAYEITNCISNLLFLNDQYITKPLLKKQERPWIGTLWAPLQAIASAIVAVAAGTFGLLAGCIGLICTCAGQKIGRDLLKSAKVALLNEPSAKNKEGTGAFRHLALACFSVFNMLSGAWLAHCMTKNLKHKHSPAV
jgi:hypothetical protein